MKKLAALFALLLAAVALVACGGGSSSTSESTSESNSGASQEEKSEAGKEAQGGTAGSSSVNIEANPEGNLEFVQKSATAKAGKVSVDFTNSSPVPHDVAIESKGGETLGQTEVLAEGSDSTTVNLKPGEYTFYCTVPGHREAGMEGTLTVK
jgi:plastocyanin